VVLFQESYLVLQPKLSKIGVKKDSKKVLSPDLSYFYFVTYEALQEGMLPVRVRDIKIVLKDKP